MSIQKAVVIGATGDIGVATVHALRTAGATVIATGRERDATDRAQVAALLEESDPDLVVVAAGTRPRMAAVDEHDWQSFSAAWNVDVRITFEVGQAVLARPLRRGATVMILSSGAAVNEGGSPLSGGYAGAKRMQMFLAGYLQRAADAHELGIRFVALAPLQLVRGTHIGEAAATAYRAAAGPSSSTAADDPRTPLDAAGVAGAIVSIASAREHPDATNVGVTGDGLTVIS